MSLRGLLFFEGQWIWERGQVEKALREEEGGERGKSFGDFGPMLGL